MYNWHYPMSFDKYTNSRKEFHLEMPLYLEIDLSTEETSKKIHELMYLDDTIDAYCTECKKESVFDTTQSYPHQYNNWNGDNGIGTIRFECSRDSSHEYKVYYLKDGNRFLKIGQYPSTADFQIPQAEKYRKVLGEEKYKEFIRGIGLAAHGIGIGSFIYLRRIFENLIQEARRKINDKKFPEKKYKSAKMDEKIKMLEKYLPKFLVENRSLYKILSTGVHELDDAECLKYFETVKIGIEQILDEQIIKVEQEEKAEKAKKAISATLSEVGKTDRALKVKTLVIKNATYGANGVEENVTTVLNNLIQDNHLSTIAANELLVSKDPAPGIPKLLTIEYEYEEKVFKKEFAEGTDIQLP